MIYIFSPNLWSLLDEKVSQRNYSVNKVIFSTCLKWQKRDVIRVAMAEEAILQDLGEAMEVNLPPPMKILVKIKQEIAAMLSKISVGEWASNSKCRKPITTFIILEQQPQQVILHSRLEISAIVLRRYGRELALLARALLQPLEAMVKVAKDSQQLPLVNLLQI